METLLANLSGKIRREVLNGRDYIVAPLTLIVPGVLSGSKGALYYPPEEVRRDPTVWNHIPIVVYHPTYNGEHVSARDPVILERQGIGHVFRANARNKAGKLVAEGWFDEEKTRKVDRRILDNLKSGKPIELSTGLFTDNDLAENGASYNGKPYQFTARNYRPDHLAILPDQVGACSIQDGCGVLVNEKDALGHGSDKRDDKDKGRLEAQAIAAKYAVKRAAYEEKLKARLATANSSLVVNPPSWAVDEDKWDRAKAAADKGNYEGDTYWQVVSHIYQNMGGEIGSKATKNSEAIINQPRHQIDGQFLPTAGPAIKQTTTAAVKGYESSEGGSALVGEPNVKGEDGRGTFKLVKELLGKDFDGDNDLEEDAENLDAFQDSVDATKETNNYRLETIMPKRDVILAKLIANCKCEESKCALNKLDDEMLTNLYAGLVANKAKTDESKSSAIGNMNDDLAEGEEDEDSEVDKSLKEGAKIDKDKMMYKDKMSGNQHQHTTMAEWEAGMPDEARAVWNAAKEVERAERARIVQRLVVNIEDEKEREVVGNQLFKRKVDELRLLLRLVPNPTNNFRIQQEREESYTNYLGASGGPATTNRFQDSAADDVLDLPTLNYEEIATEQRKQKVTA